MELIGFIERNKLDSFVKAYFESREKAKANELLSEPTKMVTTKRGKRPRNSIKGGGYVRPLAEREQPNFEGIERPKG